MNRSVVFLLIAIAIAGLIWWSSQPVTTAKSSGGKAIVDVTTGELTQLAQDGKTHFDAYCVACHGENASGVEGSGPPLIHKIYEPGHHGDGAFLIAAQRGVRAHHWPFGNMPPVEDIKQSEISAIITYVRELQKINKIF